MTTVKPKGYRKMHWVPPGYLEQDLKICCPKLSVSPYCFVFPTVIRLWQFCRWLRYNTSTQSYPRTDTTLPYPKCRYNTSTLPYPRTDTIPQLCHTAGQIQHLNHAIPADWYNTFTLPYLWTDTTPKPGYTCGQIQFLNPAIPADRRVHWKLKVTIKNHLYTPTLNKYLWSL